MVLATLRMEQRLCGVWLDRFGEMASEVDSREDFPKRSSFRVMIIRCYILKVFSLRQENHDSEGLENRSMNAKKSYVIPGPSNYC